MTGKILFLNRAGRSGPSLKGTSGDWMSDLDWSRVHGRLLIVADDERRVPSIWTIRSDESEQAKVLRETEYSQRVGHRQETRSTTSVAPDRRSRCTRSSSIQSARSLPASRYRSSTASKATKDSASPPMGRGLSTQRRRITPTSG